jgi:hypothetical protein
MANEALPTRQIHKVTFNLNTYLIEFVFIFNTKLVYESRDYVDSFDVNREGENLVKVHRVIGNDQLKLQHLPCEPVKNVYSTAEAVCVALSQHWGVKKAQLMQPSVQGE